MSKNRVGRPILNKTTVTKSIKLDENEVQFWDSKAVHEFLQGKNKYKILLKRLYILMGNMEFEEDYEVTPEDEELVDDVDLEVGV